LPFEPSIVGFVFENEVDDTGKLFGNDGTSNGLIGPSEDLLVEPFVFGVVLDSPDGHIGKGDLEVLVSVLAA
jgi:hypothetical protein